MGGIVVYPKNSGGGASEHNELEGIQGGGANENYHLTESEHDGVQALLYKNSVSSFSLAPAIGELGRNVLLTAGYNIATNDDVFISAKIKDGNGANLRDVFEFINNGNMTASMGNRYTDNAFSLSLVYSRNGVNTTENKPASYTAVVPQFAGFSALDDFENYSDLSAALSKYIQASAAISKQFSPAGEYIWFVSRKENAVIQDVNNFTQTVGAWNDGVSEFYTKHLEITLFNGITNGDVYLYRSRNPKTLSNFTYKIS